MAVSDVWVLLAAGFAGWPAALACGVAGAVARATTSTPADAAAGLAAGGALLAETVAPWLENVAAEESELADGTLVDEAALVAGAAAGADEAVEAGAGVVVAAVAGPALPASAAGCVGRAEGVDGVETVWRATGDAPVASCSVAAASASASPSAAMAIGKLASATAAAVEAVSGEGELAAAKLDVAGLDVARPDVAELGVPAMVADGVVVAGVVVALVCPAPFAGSSVRDAVAPAAPDTAARADAGACLAAVASIDAGEPAAPGVAGWTCGAGGVTTARLAAAAAARAFAEAASVAAAALALADVSLFAPLALDEVGLAGLVFAGGALTGARAGELAIWAVSD